MHTYTQARKHARKHASKHASTQACKHASEQTSKHQASEHIRKLAQPLDTLLCDFYFTQCWCGTLSVPESNLHKDGAKNVHTSPNHACVLSIFHRWFRLLHSVPTSRYTCYFSLINHVGEEITMQASLLNTSCIFPQSQDTVILPQLCHPPEQGDTANVQLVRLTTVCH